MSLVTSLERDMVSMRQAIARLSSIKLGPTSTPTFGSGTITNDLAVGNDLTVGGSFTLTGTLTLSSLTASRLIATNADKELVSSDLNNWIAGTANEINITDDGDGTVTIGLVDPLIVSKGGSGAATFTDHSLLVGSGTDAFTALGAATNGQLPIGSTGNDPVLAALTGTANQITVTNGAGSITLSTPQDIDTACDFECTSVTATGTIQAEQLTSTDDINADGNLYLDNGGQSYVYGGDETGEDLILRANTIDAKDYFAAYGAAGLLLNFSTGNNISFVENDTAEYTFDATTFDAKANNITTTGSGTFASVFVNQDSDGVALEIDSEATTLTNYGLKVITGQGAGTAIFSYGAEANGTFFCGLPNNGSYAGNFYFLRDLAAASTDGAVVYIHQDNADDDQPALEIQQDGSGYALLTNGNIKCDGDMTVTGTTTYEGNIVIPDNGYIGSVSDTDAIQIAADGVVTLTQKIAVGGDIEVTGNILFMADRGGLGYNDNSPMIVFDDTNNRVEFIGNIMLADDGTIGVSDGEPSILFDNTDGQVEVTGILTVSSTASITGAITAANYTAANLLTACATNAGALDFSASSKTLTVSDDATVSGTNTGDQTSIVGITGTKAEFDTACTDGNFLYVGDAPTAHTHDTDTLQLDGINSDGGAFSFTTSDAVTFSQDIILNGTENIGIDLSGGTWSVSDINLTADPTINENGSFLIRSESTAAYNLFIGKDAFSGKPGGITQARADGTYNVCFGFEAGYNNDSGAAGTAARRNVYIGYQSGKGNAAGNSGYENVGIGYGTLTSLISGYSNFALGYAAMSACTTGYGHVCIGNGAGGSLTNAERNVYIGGESGRLCNGSYNVCLGNNTMWEAENTENNNVCIGYNTGRCIEGTQVWESRYNILIGPFCGVYSSTGDSNVAIGWSSLGTGAGSAQTGISQNTVIGHTAGYSMTASSVENVMVGYSSGYSITSGDSNVLIGYKSGNRLTTESDILMIDNQDRGSAAAELTNALIYGVFNATPTSQILDVNASFGILEPAPVTIMEMTHTAPYITLHNSTNEDGDGGRESRIIARGQQSGEEETVLGYIEFAHDGAADDQKGLCRCLVNDGDDGTTPSKTGWTVRADGLVEITDLQFNGQGGQAWLMQQAASGNSLSLQGQTSGAASAFNVFNADGDGTDNVGFGLYLYGTPDQLVNTHSFNVSGLSTGQWWFYSYATGDQTAGKVKLYTQGQEQFVAHTTGDCGVGDPTPSYKLEVAGTGYFSGAVTTGGADPPYELFWNENRESVRDRIKRQVPPMYLDGCALFYNGETDQMELFLPSKGEYRTLDNRVVETIAPIAETFPTKMKYHFDELTGEIIEHQAESDDRIKHRIKEGYEFDTENGKFYQLNEKGIQRIREVDKVEAIKLIHKKEVNLLRKK